jgi:hypothetical protein
LQESLEEAMTITSEGIRIGDNHRRMGADEEDGIALSRDLDEAWAHLERVRRRELWIMCARIAVGLAVFVAGLWAVAWSMRQI